jgi:F-type H+-transporting ATPase subunit gamma
MATLREVRARISGVKKTEKITKAMKMVAAAKLRRAQTAVVAARPYARKIQELLQHLNANAEILLNPLLVPRETNGVALVVVTADRGMCGPFNSNVIKAALGHTEFHYQQFLTSGQLKLFCVGRKGADFFTKQRYSLAGRYTSVYNNLVFAETQKIVHDIVVGYLNREFDKVEVIYNEFKSVTRQRIVVEPFLPIPPEAIGTAVKSTRLVNYIYEPSSRHIAHAMVPRHVDFQMWRIVLESNAAEQAARMTAMDNATENANELITTLQLLYNKARQAAITKELLEVVSGSEALRSSE